MTQCTGRYQGREVALKWGPRGGFAGDTQALKALARLASDRVDETIVLEDGTRLQGNLLATPDGFVYCCALLLDGFETDYIPPEMPEGVTVT